MDESFKAILCLRYYINDKNIEKMIYDWAIFLHYLDLYQGKFEKMDKCYRCGKIIKFQQGKYYHYTFDCIQKEDLWDIIFNRTYDFIFGIDLKKGLEWRLKEFTLEEKISDNFNSNSVVVKLGNY